MRLVNDYSAPIKPTIPVATLVWSKHALSNPLGPIADISIVRLSAS